VPSLRRVGVVTPAHCSEAPHIQEVFTLKPGSEDYLRKLAEERRREWERIKSPTKIDYKDNEFPKRIDESHK